MARTLILDTVKKAGEEVLIKGWVRTRRDHGKLIFLDIYDRTGVLQAVVNAKVSEEAYKNGSILSPQDVIEIRGEVKKRPENSINKDLKTGSVELEAKELSILAKSETLPFDMGGKDLNLELPTLLDHRSLTLRHPKVISIFKLQESIVDNFRKIAKELGCTEIFTPTITASATEGGADVFAVDYYAKKAYLAQSPQLYKQMMVGVFERVFTIAHAYRAEPSVTTRHLSEIVQLDIEIGFAGFEELLDLLELVGTAILKNAAEENKGTLSSFGVDMPLVPDKIPRLKFREAQKIITERTGRDLSKEPDLNPEDEKEICAWARETHKSDFVTITHFPTRKKPFYTMPDPKDPEYSLSYDLLFNGEEISSGSQRINEQKMLIESMEKRGIDPKKFGMYLQAFKYGIPKEGGFSFGLERLTMKLLKLKNIREASLYPRDMERVDERFSLIYKKEPKK
ncbi:MAG: aspartate--tRNA(Asn) ligase [Patescibacteria group bacterium]|nr:aspartate--tRNA(Asn) ligase [Patescibacteria group bacterium]